MRRLAAVALLFAPAALQAQASPSPYTSATRYDAVGRVTGTISADPDGAGPLPFLAARSTYDGAGRLARVETGTLSVWQSEAVAPSAWGSAFTASRATDFQYDGSGRKLREWTREGSAGAVRTLTEYSYADGRLSCTAVRMNPAVFTFSGTPNACVPGQQGQAPNDYGPDRITKNVYDIAGQRVQLREGVGSADEAAEATWDYSPNGRVIAVIDGNGNRAELRYDGYDQQDRWIFPSTTRPSAYNDATQATALLSAGATDPNDYEEYGYDANGNRTSLRKRDNAPTPYGNIAYEYDALNRMTRKTVPERPGLSSSFTRDVFYGHDLRGLQLFARYDSAAGDGVSSSYDGFGRMLSQSIAMNGTTRTLSYAWDRNGNRRRVTHPGGAFFEYTYDELNRLILLGENGATSGAGAMVQVGYAADGAATAATRSNGTLTSLGYDGVGRLNALDHNVGGGTVHDVQWTYGRNPASGLSSAARTNDTYAWTGHYAVARVYQTDGLNRYNQAVSSLGATNYGYDGNGNLTSDGANTFIYDVENRLIVAYGARNVTLTYDPLGRLFEYSHYAGAWVTTAFHYDGDALVGEYNGSTLLRRYVHGSDAGADDPLVWYEGADLSERRFLHADHQGSAVAVSNFYGDGLVIAINRYDEYGIPGSNNIGRFQYTGQAYLAELGMYYYKARIYSPTLGRFLQTDPVGYAGGINLYAYVSDDPVNRSDPSGLAPNREAATNFETVARRVDRGGIDSLEGNGGGRERYFYTTRFGWIDVRHFGTAANMVIAGSDPGLVNSAGILAEMYQWATEWGDDYRSGFSEEDTTSNLVGASFGEYVRNDTSGRTVGELFRRFGRYSGAPRGDSEHFRRAYNSLPARDPAYRGGRGGSSGNSNPSGSNRSTADSSEERRRPRRRDNQH